MSTKVNRKIIEIDEALCNGCGQCIVDCAESALKIINGKAKLIADKYCDGLGACMSGCPTGALSIIERLSDDFDEEAVEELIRSQKETQKSSPCGCPSANLQSFKPLGINNASAPSLNSASESALSHWPVQIRLVPPTAPFLQNADLLIAADCSAIAYANFHQDLLNDRVVMMGCPKFDDADSYVAKFVDIFSNAKIKSICLAIMEVPCCQNMKNIVRAAMKQAGKDIPTKVAVISTRGAIEWHDSLEKVSL